MVLEAIGFLVGVIYLWWEYNADSKVWLASIVMPAISMWIYLDKGLYADFAINIYYLAIAVYGYIAWTFNLKRRKRSELQVRRVPGRLWPFISIALCGVWYAIYFVLTRFTDSNVPVWDAFTTAGSIVAMWMLARKFAQQWLLWLLVDAVCVALYIYKGIYLYAILYAVYTVIAWLGYRKWLSMIPA
ncbi:MAG: nicotinamide riboside transporter PnuC [Muribaculum sp.]|nr:nicotinamide riboside transporter PnuC [Muribaculum sp.]